MLLLNDTGAVEFGMMQSPEYVEIHSVCLNDIFLLDVLKKHLKEDMKLVLGVGGTDVYEIEHALNYINHKNTLLMFGFQNFPTVYEDVNLNKIRKIMSLYNELDFGYADHTAWDNVHNQLVTLLGAASGMSYVEKHVTTHYGEDRIDWSAAISIDMLNDLSGKLKVLDDLNGNGELKMNKGELTYSVFGPMKKTAILKFDIKKGDVFSKDMIEFRRTEDISNMSQISVIQSFGKTISKDMSAGTLLEYNIFEEKG